ncbi:unnamed protein product, partial [marine sediment metagenome]
DKVENHTLNRIDVAANFKAPYADSANYADTAGYALSIAVN